MGESVDAGGGGFGPWADALAGFADTLNGAFSSPSNTAAAAIAVVRQAPDRRALVIRGAVVGGLLVGFVSGPHFGIAAWVVALTQDKILPAG